MKITIYAVGRVSEPYLAEGIREYRKRLAPYATLAVTEVRDERIGLGAGTSEGQTALTREGERLRAALAQGAYIVATTPRGEALSSEELARMLDRLSREGRPHLGFLIGGTLGLAEDLLRDADFRLSLSRLTFPHQLARLILMEQLYRSYKILRGEPYHR
ncbi:MAG: 23S rRNA (pseudouridine(1915)-N(3))-methyltransferase RlmH [Firmicutes bacterium]|nr:23S rRNA (pseudouridine(1915)-N(3))-methyltransferase RlmH [Bacillota bacterium]